jgi:flagellar basal body-associated protein FliL
MKDHSGWVMLVVMIVTFIAGYSVVSFAVRKFKEATAKPGPDEQDRQLSNPATRNTESTAADQRNHQED